MALIERARCTPGADERLTSGTRHPKIVEVYIHVFYPRSAAMRRFKALSALTVLLSVLGVGMANPTPSAAKPVLPAARVADCCDAPACPPGCSTECPPNCNGSTLSKLTACCDCPPCPFCP
jgi:hypothetical protein